MKPKLLYLTLCVLGTILPYYYFLPFVFEHGLDISLFIQELFANSISGFFAMDVFVSSLVLWVFAFFQRRKVKYFWVAIFANIIVGVSLGLPLLLYLREVQGSTVPPVSRRFAFDEDAA